MCVIMAPWRIALFVVYHRYSISSCNLTQFNFFRVKTCLKACVIVTNIGGKENGEYYTDDSCAKSPLLAQQPGYLLIPVKSRQFIWRSEGLQKLPSLIHPLGTFFILQKCMFYSLNYFDIWRVSLQLSCGDICQTWNSTRVIMKYFRV